jgi:hypothetical protein
MNNLEFFINEQRAEITALRVALQVLLIRTISVKPDLAEETLQDLKTHVLGALSRMQTDPQNPGTLKSKAFANAKGEEFFEELEDLMSVVRNKRGESGRN